MSCTPTSIRAQLDVAEMMRTIETEQKRAAERAPALVREELRAMFAKSLEETK